MPITLLTVATAASYLVDERRVVHETIDGESIVINLASGNYYSLAGSGSEIWTMLAAGCTEDYVVGELERVYESDGDEIRTAVSALARQLGAENLLQPGRNGGAESAAAAVSHLPLTPGRGRFVAPALETYTDMQYFLLLDPIHEVEAAGWPHERRAAVAD
jgi:Coenzyme PQQ synthesis protein D (PqqD)